MAAAACSKMVFVSIEGNIGAGKSTLMQALKAKISPWNFIEEPVGLWQTLKNERDESLLDVYYKDPKRWSYTFQSCALLSRFQNVSMAVENVTAAEAALAAAAATPSSSSAERQQSPHLLITERCLDTDYQVFTKMLCDDGCIDKLEFEIYNRLYQHLQSQSVPLGGIIYVDTEPPECMRRIKSRARPGEDTIPLEYLQKLDQYQRRWVANAGIPTMTTTSDAASIEAVDRFLNALMQRTP